MIKKEILKTKPDETKLGFSLRSLKDKINEVINTISNISILNILDVEWYDARKYATDSLKRKNGISGAVNQVGSKNKTILVTSQQDIESDLTVPSNITLQFSQGGVLNISSGKTITINGDVEAGVYQIFKGSGSVSFGAGSVDEVYTEWWGVDGTDDHLELNKAITALPSIGGKIKLVSKTYSWFDSDTTAPTNKDYVTVEGKGQSTKIEIKSDITPFVIDNIDQTIWRNFYVRLKAGTTTKPVIDLFVNADGEQVRYNLFENIFIYDESAVANRGATGIRLHAEAPSADTSNITENIFHNIQLFFMAIGIKLETDVSDNPYVNGNRFDDIWLFHPEVGVEMSKNSTSATAISRNLFTNTKIQIGGWSTDGFKNITNNGNVFIDALIWDWGSCASPNYQWSIDAQANDTFIHTTVIDYTYLSDSGTDTFIFTPNHIFRKLTLSQLTYDTEILEFKSSDVGHGVTDRIETDSYGHIKKAVGASGGVQLEGISEDERALSLTGIATNDNTDKDATARAVVEIVAGKKSGTGWGAMGADGNLFAIREYGSTRFIVDEDGDVLYDGSAGAYQGEDDIALLAELEDSLSGKIEENEIKNKDIYKKYKIIYNNNFVSTKKKSMLLYGAIRQLNEKIISLTEEIERLKK